MFSTLSQTNSTVCKPVNLRLFVCGVLLVKTTNDDKGQSTHNVHVHFWSTKPADHFCLFSGMQDSFISRKF